MVSPPAEPTAIADTDFAALLNESGQELDGRHSGDYLRLQRLLEHGDGFQLIFAACTSFAYRQFLIARLALRNPTGAIVSLSENGDASALFDELRAVGPQHRPIHLIGIDAWLRHGASQALQGVNYRRESLAADLPTTLLLWMEPGNISTFAREAPDLWAWRTAVLDFSHPPQPRAAVHQDSIFLGKDERSRREERLAAITAYLQTLTERCGHDAHLLLEASEIEQSLGRPEIALDHAHAASMLFRELDDRLGEALSAGRIADILQERGQLDEALHIRQKEELPVYERLGDVRSKAVTQGKIADILEARGQLDEVLRIRREEELPVYERLGDLREKTVTQGKIADILQAQGQLDQALRIYTDEVLPVFERLNEVRSKAVTQVRIADILQARGQLDEALRIYTEEGLPVFERLGDVREKAMTLGKITDILQARGQLDEALRIRKDEVLPVFEHLGDVRSKALTQGKIADILAAHGELHAALALHQQRLPIAQRMGDIDCIAHIYYCTAKLRLQLGEHKTGGLLGIRDDLAEAFAISRQLGLPDAIKAIGRLFAQVLALGGEREPALEVLNQTAAALTTLNDAAGLAKVRELRGSLARQGVAEVPSAPTGLG